uniref:(northern house mosquito) hypothetical protein n=1 Tax=Culex pipiens TaxID=7175 RepID=A0A8D8NS15_CULPI
MVMLKVARNRAKIAHDFHVRRTSVRVGRLTHPDLISTGKFTRELEPVRVVVHQTFPVAKLDQQKRKPAVALHVRHGSLADHVGLVLVRTGTEFALVVVQFDRAGGFATGPLEAPGRTFPWPNELVALVVKNRLPAHGGWQRCRFAGPTHFSFDLGQFWQLQLRRTNGMNLWWRRRFRLPFSRFRDGLLDENPRRTSGAVIHRKSTK